MDIPGFKVEDITINLDYNNNRKSGQGGVLYVGGTRTNRLGRSYEFHRRFALNKVPNASLDTITANLSEDGVLDIVVPKLDEAEPLKKTRTIPIATPSTQAKSMSSVEAVESEVTDGLTSANEKNDVSQSTCEMNDSNTIVTNNVGATKDNKMRQEEEQMVSETIATHESQVDPQVVVETVLPAEEAEDVTDGTTATLDSIEPSVADKERADAEETARGIEEVVPELSREEGDVSQAYVDNDDERHTSEPDTSDEWEDVAETSS